MINPVDRLSWQEMLNHPASAGHLVDTQVNTAYNKMAVLSDHIDEFKDLYDFIFRIKGWLRYYLQANYGLEDFSDIGLNNDTNGHSGSIDLIDPATGEVKTKKVWRIYIKNYDEMVRASEAGLPIPDPIVRFANIYDPLNPVYLDLEYKNGKPTFSGTFNPDDTNSYIPLWYLNEQIAQLRRDLAKAAGSIAAGSKITLVGDATGSGTVDANGNVVVPTAVSRAANAAYAANAAHATKADHAADSDHADEADHAKVADSITGLVFDSQIEGSGYQKFPGGLLIQWVTTRFILPDNTSSGKNDAGIDVSNNFVIPFASAPVAIFAAEGRSLVQSNNRWEAGEWSVGIKDVSTSAFTFRAIRNHGSNIGGDEWSECVVVAFGKYGDNTGDNTGGNSGGNSGGDSGTTPSINHSPTVTVRASSTKVSSGSEVTITAYASDPDGDNLSYEWNTGATSRSITVSASGTTRYYNCTVYDPYGGSATSNTVSVSWYDPMEQKWT